MSPPFDASVSSNAFDGSAAPPLIDFTYSRPASTAFVTALVVIVAPDRRYQKHADLIHVLDVSMRHVAES